MEDTACNQCGFNPLPEGARFCHQCGHRIEANMSPNNVQGNRPESEKSVIPTFLWPVGTILLTLGLSWFLMTVLHWPVFILGAFLPLAWRFSKKRP